MCLGTFFIDYFLSFSYNNFGDCMLNFIWYGTNSFKIYDNDNSILFDPFIRFSKIKDKSFYKNFTDEKNIFITHGHIDHILNIPKLYKNKNCKIYALKNIYKRLLKRGIKKNQLVHIDYNETINLGKFKIVTYKSKHIKFDLKLILSTTFNINTIKYFKRALYLGYNHIKNPLKNEIVAYEIKYDKISIFSLGSMNLDKNTIYPKGVDYLILAYQGRSDLDEKIKDILEILKPKKIILTHFDNSFPPISKDVNLENIKKLNNVIIPEYEKIIKLK